MAVLLPNAQLIVRKRAHQFARDAHGAPVAGSSLGDPIGPFPGAVVEPDDKDPALVNQYRIRVDCRCWPLRKDDEVTDDTGRVFVVRTARNVTVPGNSAVDFIRATADLIEPEVP